MSLLVIDKTEESELRDLFTLFGTSYKGTKLFWLGVPVMIITGILVAFAVAPVADTTGKIIAGIGYGLLAILASYIHGLGHVISSRQVGAPVSYMIMSMTVTHTHYNDTEELPSRVHIGRAIGGPIASLIAGLIGLALYGVTQIHFFCFLCGGESIGLLFDTDFANPIIGRGSDSTGDAQVSQVVRSNACRNCCVIAS